MIKEACAWIPRTEHLLLMRALSNLHLFMSSNGYGSPRKDGDPYIDGYKVLDDGGATGNYQLRVEGLKAAQLKRIVGAGIDVTMEDA